MNDDDKVTCSNCESQVDSDDLRDMDGTQMCPECSIYCEDCSTLVPSDDSVTANDGDTLLCSDCGWNCEQCDERYTRSSYTVYSNGYEQDWCQGCYENCSWYCDRCEVSHSERYDYTNVQGEAWCEDCFNDYGWYCEDCDQGFPDGESCDCDGVTSGGNTRCGKCGSSGNVHNYSCKPDLVFHGFSTNKVYMGFELETQIRKREMNALGEASKYANEQLAPDNIAILKEDGSIGREGYGGFEIVTQPHTLDQYRYKSDKLWDTIETLRTDYDARAWDTTTCGLHVHVSRAGFSGGAHTHRWLTLIYKNAEHMMKLAGRKSSYARFNDVWTFDEYDRPVFSLAHKVADPRGANTERYSAVNTQNQHTLELRFFRGTMNKTGILSALDLVQASVEYTRHLSLSDVKMGALGWDWFIDYVEQNNGLYPDLYSRLPRLSSVDINRPITMNA